ncbi:hypothetical protein PR003_g19449 [Phytophthora rubi]|uniref:Secreted protein n=1 Tax=Phytophthora rubi TaxID=129364 RepID=A0A6A4DZA9_9STRA|nr:hypothetical protein PR003_g19449 [Phytophthora rubi]
MHNICVHTLALCLYECCSVTRGVVEDGNNDHATYNSVPARKNIFVKLLRPKTTIGAAKCTHI